MHMRLVLIEWVDAYGCSSSWEALEDPFKAPHVMTCRSVGWLVYDGEDRKVLVPHIAKTPPEEADQGCGDMTIPAVAIRRITDLAPAPEPGS